MGRLPFDVVRLPKQRRLAGCLASVLSVVLLLACVIGGIALVEPEDVPPWVGVPLFAFLLFFAGALSVRISEYGRKLRQPDALSLLAKDPRPPVLFLRSFHDEDVVDLTARTGRGGMRRAEEALCRALRQLGPVVAIGRPDEALPEVGAARLYVDDENWRKAVRYFLEHAAAVVVVVGESAGVWWEIETALEVVDRRRLLFFFPYLEKKGERRSFWHGISPRARVLRGAVFEAMKRARDERYRLFRERLDETLAAQLPDGLDQAQFVDFRDGSTPRVLPTVRPAVLDTILQASLTNLKVGIHLEKTLQPYVAKLVNG